MSGSYNNLFIKINQHSLVSLSIYNILKHIYKQVNKMLFLYYIDNLSIQYQLVLLMKTYLFFVHRTDKTSNVIRSLKKYLY